MNKSLNEDKNSILGIYGAGPLGREVFELATVINKLNNFWSQIIFIDDADEIYNPRKLVVVKFSEIKSLFPKSNIEICIATGEPSLRNKLYDKIIANEYKLATLIHPDVVIPNSTKIGKGTIICKFLSITCDIIIGDNVYIHPNACIGHDAKIGAHSVISSYVDISGYCNIGISTFLGVNVCMRQKISIGNDTIIGMGSVVHRDIPDSVIALGNPARVMKNNENQTVFPCD
ncbi:MAG: sugar O-acyltransferase [Flavobacteriaceae bacterium]|nr:sugar O-acyltransferase [Flavobacteriaceae bacterium]|tara:strand:- start:5639 stop:6331 length:693 start_codon:yes stop_codon:yes gene_type:complete